MLIGSHTSFANKQLLGCVQEALSYGANTFMFYTGAPQNSIRKSIDMEYTKEAWELMKENNIDIDNVICHVPYIVNLANPKVNEFGTTFLNSEIVRCTHLGVKKLILHPGSATGVSKGEGIENIITCLNKVITKDMDCIILLETMSGKGNECGSTLEELKEIIDSVILKDKIGVCLDTCHLNDAGYDMSDFDSFLDLFDDLIGLNKIYCVHLNDSKNELNTHKDRHANIGFGTMSFTTLLNIVYNERLKNVPKILETPYYEEKAPYKEEIEMLRDKQFNSNLYSSIKENS